METACLWVRKRKKVGNHWSSGWSFTSLMVMKKKKVNLEICVRACVCRDL